MFDALYAERSLTPTNPAIDATFTSSPHAAQHHHAKRFASRNGATRFTSTPPKVRNLHRLRRRDEADSALFTSASTRPQRFVTARAARITTLIGDIANKTLSHLPCGADAVSVASQDRTSSSDNA